MASSLSKSQHASCNTFHVIFFVFLLVGSCTATRPGVMVMVHRKSTVNSEHMKTLPEKNQTGFRYRDYQIFGFFPKGMPVPPSGPSRGHNSEVDSTHN
nr:protein ida [Quercus suber]